MSYSTTVTPPLGSDPWNLLEPQFRPNLKIPTARQFGTGAGILLYLTLS